MDIPNDLPRQYVWPENDLTRIPDWVYTDPGIYRCEVERIFHGRTWNCVGLEAEIPDSGDFIRSNVGPTPVVVSRTEDGSIAVFENRCTHRAAEFCRELTGNLKVFVCPYHQWTYDLHGNLQAVPFRRGVQGQGGMGPDFVLAEHSLRQLAVTTHRGVIFASYADDMESLAAILHLTYPFRLSIISVKEIDIGKPCSQPPTVSRRKSRLRVDRGHRMGRWADVPALRRC